MERKGCGADAENEKFERFLEKKGHWEEKRVFWRNPKGDSIEEKRKAWGRILKVSEGLEPRE